MYTIYRNHIHVTVWRKKLHNADTDIVGEDNEDNHTEEAALISVCSAPVCCWVIMGHPDFSDTERKLQPVIGDYTTQHLIFFIKIWKCNSNVLEPEVLG